MALSVLQACNVLRASSVELSQASKQQHKRVSCSRSQQTSLRPPLGAPSAARARMLHASSFRTKSSTRATPATCAAAEQQSSTKSFYNRDVELSFFEQAFATQPSEVWLMTGPRNSGKTALLYELQRRHMQNDAGRPASPFILLNFRASDYTTPTAFAEGLTSHQNTLSTLFSDYPTTSSDESSKGSSPSLQSTLDEIAHFLREFNRKHGGAAPAVIALDEANMLQYWKEGKSDAFSLRQLLSWLTYVSKEANLAHVVLAASDYLMLQRFVDTTTTGRLVVVGDMTNSHARNYFFQHLLPQPANGTTVIREEDWDRIYAVTGGNCTALQQLLALLPLGSLDVALEKMVRAAGSAVRAGLLPEAVPQRGSGAPAWTTEDYELVLRKLLDAPGHAVGRVQLERALGRTRPAALISMIEYNTVSLRPWCPLAQDIIWPDDADEAVTPITPSCLEYIKRMDLRGSLSKVPGGEFLFM